MKRVILLSVMSMLILVTPFQVVSSVGSSLGEGSAEGSATTEQRSSLTGAGNPADVIVHGAYLPPINHYGTEILAFNDLVGKDIGIINYYVGFYQSSWTWLPSQIQAQVPEQRRPQIMLNWVPKGRNCRTMAPDKPGDWSVNASLYDIVDGYCDDYIRHMARQLKDLPHTFLLRFAQEMNISAALWWVGHYNRDPQLYIDAYHRVYHLFAAEGVTNVQWVWSPSYSSSPREEWNSAFHYYPGDEYVDWVGVVVFNWGKWLGVPWWSLTELLDSDLWDHALPDFMCRYAKPILLDLGTVEGTRSGDGTKAGWVRDGYQALDRYPFVKAVAWFNDWDDHDPGKADFRMVGGSSLDSASDPWHVGYAYPLPKGNGSWTEAYSAAIARDKFVSYVPPLEDITPPTTWCGGEPVFETPDVIYARPGETKTFTISAMGLMEDMNVSLNGLPPLVSVTLSQPFLLKPWDEVQVRLEVDPRASHGASDIAISLNASGNGKQQEISVTFVIADRFYRAYLPSMTIHE